MVPTLLIDMLLFASKSLHLFVFAKRCGNIQNLRVVLVEKLFYSSDKSCVYLLNKMKESERWVVSSCRNSMLCVSRCFVSFDALHLLRQWQLQMAKIKHHRHQKRPCKGLQTPTSWDKPIFWRWWPGYQKAIQPSKPKQKSVATFLLDVKLMHKGQNVHSAKKMSLNKQIANSYTM